MIDPILETRLRLLDQNLSRLEKPSEFAIKFRWNSTQVENEIWNRLEKEIEKEIRQKKKKIKQLLDDLKAAASKTEAERQATMAKAWGEYNQLNAQSQPIFQECLDFISGLVFREEDKGLDANNICQVADELIWKCSKSVFVSPSLTIPAREEALVVTFGRILRLRYSEWRAWSLPLIAHEFGHVVIGDPTYEELGNIIPVQLPRLLTFDPEYKACSGNVQLSEEVRQKVKTLAEQRAVHRLHEYLADAFGTYVMGPAYACAAIHLRLNPAGSSGQGTETPIDLERAYIVLGILKEMNKRTEGAFEYQGVLDKLQRIWQGMVAAANPAELVGTLLRNEQQGYLDEVISAIYDRFDGELMRMALYPHDDQTEGWSVAKLWGKKWVQACSSGTALTIPEVSRNSMLRDALNAGWFCRIEKSEYDADVIEMRVYELCREIIQKRRAVGGSSAPLK